jgi:ATP-binding cassette subfamily B protein
MALTSMPPESVRTLLNGQFGYSISPDDMDGGGGASAGLRLSVMADISRDGTYGERWMIVDRSHIRVLTPNDGKPAYVDLDIALNELVEASTDSLVGCGALVLKTKDGRAIEAVRYTVSCAPLFSAAARAINAYIKDEPVPASLTDGLEKKHCPKCGLPLPEDTSVCVKCVDKRAVLTRLLGYTQPYKYKALLAGGLMIGATGLGLIGPKLQQLLLDDVLIPHRHFEYVGWFVVALLLSGVLNTLMTVWRGRLTAWISNRLIFALRTQAYSRLQQLSVGYYDKRQVGSLMTRVTQDVNELQNFIIDGIQFFLVNVLQIGGTLAFLLWSNWRLTLIVLTPVPLVVYMSRKIWKVLWGRLHRLWHIRSNLSASINAALSGVRVVKAFAQEARETQKFRDKAQGFFNAQVLVDQSWATYFPVLGWVTMVGIYSIWYFGGFEVFHNRSNNPAHGMTVGLLTMFLSYTWALMGPLQGLTRLPDWLSRSTAAAERVFEVIDADPEIDNHEEAVAMPYIEGRVQFKDVRFSYDKNQAVIEDISIDVAPGEMIGLVGHSGAGKTTIINLLLRFYDVKEGSILIDGVDIRRIRMDDLRRQIGVVLQEPFLFPGTICENIAYAKPDATPTEIMRAAKAANAHDFIMRMPDGYDTYVGERGMRLSGGERQRLSIARAILHDPRILILDEATASVDTETEKQIQDAISRLIQGRTTFAIAHRLSTLRNASRLMVMDKGKLVELGTHDELQALPEGVFRKLVEMQQEVNKLHVV